MTALLILKLVALGAGAGGLGALLGIGGGLILVPALVFLADLSFTHAVGTSLVCVVGTSVASSAVLFSRERIDVSLAIELQCFAVAGAVTAGLLAPFVPVRLLYVAFALVLLVAAWRTVPRPALPAAVPPGRRSGSAARAGALGGGTIASLLGVGGGVVFVPLLHLVAGLDFHRSAATSVYIIGVTAGSGALVYVARGVVDLEVVVPTMLGVLAGATAAAANGHRLDARGLKLAFALLLVYVAGRMLWRGVAGG